MIGKSAVWGPMTASGGALVCVMAVAGGWFALMPRVNRPPEISANPFAERRLPSPTASSAPFGASLGPRVDVVRVMPNGEVVVAGRAEPGARVALLDSGQTLLETQSDPASGEFVFLPPRLVAGEHRLSLRSTASSDGAPTTETAIQAFSIAPQIKAAIAVTFTPAAAGQTASRGGEATVVRGDTLWRVSRAKLGRGALYPTIYQANSAKIHDPNLIYPNQILTIP